MRVFAGPNGSGKTTIIDRLKDEIHFGVYVNADDIERAIENNQSLSFDDYRVKVKEAKIKEFFRKSHFAPVKRSEPNLWEKLTIKNNILHISTVSDSYLAADIAEFLRQQLLGNDISFTYETVMSHSAKIDFLKKANGANYRVYLYYIATEDPDINVTRVNVRVAQQGHFVPAEVIKSRYYRSLENLRAAIKNTSRAFIFDNSGTAAYLIAEITNGKGVNIVDTDKVPNWFVRYLIEG